MYDQTYDGGAGLAAFGMIFMMLGLFWYFWSAWTQLKIAQKCGQSESAWWSFIPLLNVFLWVKMAGREWWWTILTLFIPFAGIVPSIDVAKNCGHKPFWGVLCYIPFLNLIAMGVMAFGRGTYTPAVSPTQYDRPRQPTGVA